MDNQNLSPDEDHPQITLLQSLLSTIERAYDLSKQLNFAAVVGLSSEQVLAASVEQLRACPALWTAYNIGYQKGREERTEDVQRHMQASTPHTVNDEDMPTEEIQKYNMQASTPPTINEVDMRMEEIQKYMQASTSRNVNDESMPPIHSPEFQYSGPPRQQVPKQQPVVLPPLVTPTTAQPFEPPVVITGRNRKQMKYYLWWNNNQILKKRARPIPQQRLKRDAASRHLSALVDSVMILNPVPDVSKALEVDPPVRTVLKKSAFSVNKARENQPPSAKDIVDDSVTLHPE